MIRNPTFIYSDPSDDHPLVEIFNAAVAPLAELLQSFPDDHPVVSSYSIFFMDRPENHRDAESHIEKWLSPSGLAAPFQELAALMQRPLDKLQDFHVLSVRGPEWRRRVIGVGRAMLQLLALQHELEEPLNLNGDTFDDLVEGDIKLANLDTSEATRAMFLATKPKQLSHKKYWKYAAFGESL